MCRAGLKPAKRALVIGGGTMGASIAYALNTAGITVTLVETDADAQARARANVGRLFQDAVKRGLMDQVAADARFAIRQFLLVGRRVG